MDNPKLNLLRTATPRFLIAFILTFLLLLFPAKTMNQKLSLLTDPFLQLPTTTSVRVVWFTDFEGLNHTVNYGVNLEQQVIAHTTKLTRTREDDKSQPSRLPLPTFLKYPTYRPIWRNEAEVIGLKTGDRLPYQVTSIRADGNEIKSNTFALAPLPQPGQPLKILLTSDHQLMPMTAANLQKVTETIGQIDAVFLAGDLVNIPDRASEWFDDRRGGSFFPCLQGRAHYTLVKNGRQTTYQGGQIIQNAPLFPAIGNHEVMGRFANKKGLNEQFSDPYPRTIAQAIYPKIAHQINPEQDPDIEQAWLKANSFNTDTYEEIFTLPKSPTGGQKYYAVTFGDIRLVVLFVTNIWRLPQLEEWAISRYREPTENLENPEKWGYGQHIFEPIKPGSAQYNWLTQELNSPQFQQAKYKIVMFHHPPHSLGDNIVPAYTDPRQIITYQPNQKIAAIRYEYPLEEDYLSRDLEPLFNNAGVQLVYYGHSHLWNRFINAQGVNFLESSNVGNTYGAFWGEKKRFIPQGYQEAYIPTGDPNGLEPIVPNLQPLHGENGEPLPYIASNDLSVFSILDTDRGTVSSYRFDTTKPELGVIKFDEFELNKGKVDF